MRGDSWAGLALSQLLLILTRLGLRCRARETLPVPVLAFSLCTVDATSEPDGCEAGTGEMTQVVADTVVVSDEKAAGVAPAVIENVMVVSVVVVSLSFNLAGEAFMVLRKMIASGGIRDRFTVVGRVDEWRGRASIYGTKKGPEDRASQSHPVMANRRKVEMPSCQCSCRAEGACGDQEGCAKSNSRWSRT